MADTFGALFQQDDPEDLAFRPGQLPPGASQPQQPVLRGGDVEQLQAQGADQPFTGDEVDEYGAFRDFQAQKLEEHNAFAQGLTQRKELLQARQQDLQIAEGFNQMMAPGVPKNVRGFLFNQMASQLGLDPKAESTKEIGKLLSGLDPETSQAVKNLMLERATDAQPGEVRQFVEAFMKGQIPLGQVVAQVSQRETEKAQQAQEEVAKTDFSGRMNLGGPKPEEEQRGTSPDSMEGQVAQATGRDLDAALLGEPSTSKDQTGLEGRVSTTLNEFIGQPVDREIDRREAARAGYGRITESIKDQEKIAIEIAKDQAGFRDLSSKSRVIYALINGRPEVLGAAGFTFRSLDSMIAQFEGLTGSNLNKDDKGNVTNGKNFKAQLAKILKNINSFDSVRSGTTAEDSAKIESAVVDLAYTIAITAWRQEGRGLSDTDFAKALQAAGKAQSPEQMIGVLQALNARVFNSMSIRTSSALGAPAKFSFRAVGDDELRAMASGAKSGITPPRFIPMIREEIQRRMGGGQQETQPRQPSGFERRTKALRDRAAEERATRKRALEADAALKEQQAAFGPNRERRAQKADARADAAAERDAERLGIARQNLSLSKQRFQAAQEEKQRARIQKAFGALAKALGSGLRAGSVGGGGGGGGDQNPNAFVSPFAKRPQRTPPRGGRSLQPGINPATGKRINQ